MALVVADRVWETTSTSGVGTLTLSGAVSGYQTFAVIGDGNTTYYTITNGTDWEVGIGTYTSSGTTLSRDTVLSSSLGGTTKINVTPGSFVFVDYPASKAVYEDASGNVTGYPISGGTINGTTIGATTPSSIVGTTITGQTGVLRGTGSNLILRSQAWATSPWFNSGLTSITNNTSDVTDPLGGNTATKIVATGSSSALGQGVTVVASPQTLSVYLRTLSGTATCDLIFYLSASPFTNIGTLNITVTSSWQRFSLVTSTATAASYNLQLNGISASTIYGWGAQVEIGSTLRDYVATTTTAVYGTPTLSFSGVSTLGLESNGALFLQPAGTGAIQAQATTSTTAGGNVRGANAVDWQTNRTAASQVASGQYSSVLSGTANTSTSFGSVLVGGSTNFSSGTVGFLGGGASNTVGGFYSTLVAGGSNSALGYYNFIGAGFTNSGTSGSAVTTQSGTMNATTAVTLSGSNANIKVGQYITGTSIAQDTYVAAISGTALTLSKVASGSSTSTLSFFTPHGVVVGGGNNQATGSYSFIGGGGDGGTAANRNVASGDWSTVGGGVKNVASGVGSVVCGGGVFGGSIFGNTASNSGSCVVGGYNNTSSGFISSMVGGNSNTANSQYCFIGGGAAGTTRSIVGNHVFPACDPPIAFAAGVSQAALLILGVQTTDATATALRSNTAAAGTTNQVILPNNSAYYFRGEIISGVTGGGDTKGFFIEGVIKRGANAASTALVGTPTVTSNYADAGASTWAIAVTADTTNGGLRVTFTGQAATTIRTVAQIRTTEMTY